MKSKLELGSISMVFVIFTVFAFSSMAFGEVNSYSFPLSYKCQARGDDMFRQMGTAGKNAVDATFMFGEQLNSNGTYTLHDFIGHVEVNSFTSSYGELMVNKNYYSHFHEVKLEQATNYKPRKYLDHVRFNLKETASNSYDGGGMNGYLVMAPHAAKANFDAHFVFQSGDHIGGTIDFECIYVD